MRSLAGSQLLRMLCSAGCLSVSLGCLCSLIAPLEPPPREETRPSWAPDGQRLVYECYLDGPVDRPGIIDRLFEPAGQLSFYTLEAADLCISDINKQDQVRLTNDPGGDWHPAWSPDGSRIAYFRKDGIYLISPDGQDRSRLMPLQTLCEQLDCPPVGKAVNMTWSPDGDSLLFSGCLDHPDRDIYVVNVDAGTVVNLTPDSRADDFLPMWTMDGTKIVFLSADPMDPSSQYSCRWDLYDAYPQLKVMNADGSEEVAIGHERVDYPFVSVSDDGLLTVLRNGDLHRVDLGGNPVELPYIKDYHRFPTWSPDDEHLAYEWPSRSINVLDVEGGGVLELQLESKGATPAPLIDGLTWSPDSDRIAVSTWTQVDLAIDSEEHIYVLDLQSQEVHPLLEEQPPEE